MDFYQDADGRAPVEEFLNALPDRVRAKGLAIIKLLEEPFPYSSQIRGRIRELRTHYEKELIRILYFADANRIFILLHGLIKRMQKLDEGDIRIAEQRMRQHEDRLRRTKRS